MGTPPLGTFSKYSYPNSETLLETCTTSPLPQQKYHVPPSRENIKQSLQRKLYHFVVIYCSCLANNSRHKSLAKIMWKSPSSPLVDYPNSKNIQNFVPGELELTASSLWAHVVIHGKLILRTLISSQWTHKMSSHCELAVTLHEFATYTMILAGSVFCQI